MSDPVIISQREALRLLENHPDIYFRGTRSGLIEIGSQISDDHTDNWVDWSARENRDRADRHNAENKHLRAEIKTLQAEVSQAWGACWQNGELADRLHRKIEDIRKFAEGLILTDRVANDFAVVPSYGVARMILNIIGDEDDD